MNVDELQETIYEAAGRVLRTQHRWVDVEDVRQEMWVFTSSLGEDQLKELSLNNLRRRLKDVGYDYARRERAAKSGYSPDDEVFYGLRTLRELLPLAVMPYPLVFRGLPDGDKPTTHRAGATPAFEYETAIADVRKAFKALPEAQRNILQAYVDTGDGTREVTSALKAMQRRLGGRRPRRG